MVRTPAGRWKKVPGRFKTRAHLVCFVVVDATASQVCLAPIVDEEATTLLAKTGSV